MRLQTGFSFFLFTVPFQRPIHGIPALYRLEERIHGIYGTEIWWSVLRQHLEANEKTRLAAFVMEIYKEYVNTPVDERKPGSGMHANWEFSPTQVSLTLVKL